MAQPRIGFAYQLDKKTVVHAGYGLYISIDGSSNGNGFGILADGFNANVVTNTVNDGVTPAMLVENGYPVSRRLPSSAPPLITSPEPAGHQDRPGFLVLSMTTP